MGNTKSVPSAENMTTSHERTSDGSIIESVESFTINKKQKQSELSDRDIQFLSSQTGLPADEVLEWHHKFFQDNPDGRLDRVQFGKFYRLLRNEPPERLNLISDHIFRAFDVDGNGYVEFGEFLLGFAISSRGDLRSRLDYAFECYDLDSNGYLTEGEIAPVLRAMYTLLGIQHVQDYPPEEVAKDLMNKLDVSKDGRVTKDEFIYYLMKDGIYRNTVNPFH
ncbi:unnamed protein product [Rotaria magnacalcarata]|uniref:EF-hand domain-containing protein n=3 Tax=Rotaria magnacalcarata TaxID=392030 RepID=A0A816RY19_9BILA|nr:unnamed protein product [Rotaria magnacalcarata]CAF1504395.1 unnamed protein product [Rotaria magnacalcarata]CAF2077191.1 unnamed protein product [Rotaria magnacalcarata]CAF2086409.1 unnamed protein product [Rotaria magnacalcarata]CAF2093871.1 unnamed protein product [Rotaria magnacalcarata]